MNTISRRSLLKGLGAAIALLAAPKAAFAKLRLVLNDASRLNPTPVVTHWLVKDDQGAAYIERLRRELKTAVAENRPVAAAAARHSMGGQSLPRDGTAITLANPKIEVDQAAKTYRATAGSRWSDVIKALDPMGFSPAVMQSNNDFGVASTFCVNAHGWPVPYGPFGSTVRSIRMMLADGEIVTCSPRENAELFNLSMGGYGLFGILLDLDVEMAENRLLRPTFEKMPGGDFADRFMHHINTDDKLLMAYGRMSVVRKKFFDEALCITYRPEPTPSDGLPPATAGGFISSLSTKVYRAQIGSETAKKARWFAETVVGPKASSGIATRNSLMNEPVANLAGNDMTRTDILHEYFVPPERFREFVNACRDIIPSATAEFLNVTLRYVAADKMSVMAFAPSPRIAAVMSFSQELTPEAETEMLFLTEALIDRVLELGGSFYLPYRLHARQDQVKTCYPRVEQFVVRKRDLDPKLVFRNAMWERYFSRF